MITSIERRPVISQPRSFESVMHEIPNAIEFAKLEAETSEIARSPEGKFALSYLLAAQKVLKPVLTDTFIHHDLLTQTGGPEYNPSRTIDDIGTTIAMTIARGDTALKHLWIRTEETAWWDPAHSDNGFWSEANRFAIIDPMDMTSAIPTRDRVQTTGIAVYDRQGNLKTVGIISLVDDSLVFVDAAGKDKIITVHPPTPEAKPDSSILRVGSLIRRMYQLKNLPIFQNNEGVWTHNCVSGYAVLALAQGKLDTVIDPIKGQPWYEFAIWHRAAQELGLPVTDPNGNPIDTAAIMRKAIEKNPNDSLRVPFVMSRTPEIHKRVLPLLAIRN